MQHRFTGPMRPAPALAPFGREADLPGGSRVFFYDSGGSGPAVFLLHGLQDEADTWRHVFAPLAARYRVVAPDLPGFGRSDKRPRGYGAPYYADIAVALADYLRIDRFAVAGNSLGAVIAEVVTLTRPERVSAMAALDGSLRVVARPASNLNLIQQLFMLDHLDRAYFERLRAGPPEACYDTLRPFYADLDALPEADRDFLFQRVNERVWDEPQRLAALAIQKGALPFFLKAGRRLAGRLPALKTPTLVVWGEQDRVFPLANARPRADAQPGAQLAILEGVGHLPQQERPERLLEAMLPFFDAAINTPILAR